MKKKHLIIVTIICLLLAIVLKEVYDLSKYKKPLDGKILEYTLSSGMPRNSFESNISLYSNKKIECYYSKDGVEINEKTQIESKERYLDDKEYNRIVSLAFSKKFYNSEKSLLFRLHSSAFDKWGASDEYITIYYNDGTSLRLGGYDYSYNPSFNKLKYLLNC